MTSRSRGTGKRHRCLAAPDCPKWVPYSEWCCSQHRGILFAKTGNYRLHATVQTAWAEWLWNHGNYDRVKRQALEVINSGPSGASTPGARPS
jgi:hypothetical protein